MKKWIKIFLISAVLIVGAGVLLFDVILEGMLKTKLESFVQQQKDRVYDYSFDDLHIQFISGNIVLSNLKIIPRNHVIDSLGKAGIPKKEIYDIRLKEFRLEGLESWRLLLKDEFHIETLLFVEPSVILYSNRNVHIGPNKELAGDIIAPNIKLVLIDHFDMHGAKFEIWNITEDSSLSVKFDSTNIGFESIQSDSALMAQGEYMTYKSVTVDINNIKIMSIKDYIYELDEIYNDYENRELHLKGLRLTPDKDKFEYMKTQEHETDWFDLNIGHLIFRKIDVAEFQRSGKIIVEGLKIFNANLELYRDKRLPDPPPKIRYLPSHMIRNIQQELSISNVLIDSSFVRYLEWEHSAEKPIEVDFKNVRMEMKNLSTLDDDLTNNDSLKIKMSSTFMGSGQLEASFIFPVLNEKDLFIAKGEISNLSLPSLNPIMQNSAFIKFEEGHLNYLNFDLVADDDFSKGSLDLDYEGLKKVEILRNKDELDVQKEKGKKRKEKKKALSILANTLIPNNYNPSLKNYYTGSISFERNKEKAIFGYLVKSIQSGIITSLIPSKQENYHELKKEKRAGHKADRRERRHEKRNKQ